MSSPVLSVIVPVWNGERYLSEAITSVLEQVDAPPLEVIVVDDGSDDDSAAVAESFGATVRCVRVTHGGLAAARNAGVAVARGEYLLHFDSDDLMPAASIASRMEALSRSPSADLAIGQMSSFLSPELSPDAAANYRIPALPQRGGLPGATLIRAGFAARVGSFDTSLTHSSDLDWMARAREHGAQIVEVPEIVLRRRIHGRNMSLMGENFASARLIAVKAALERRRQADNRCAPSPSVEP